MQLATVLWILTLVLLVFTGIAAFLRARLAGTPVVTPGRAAPGDERVMVGGVARPIDGTRPGPVSGEPVLMAIATRIEEIRERDHDNRTQTRRHSTPAGRVDTRIALVDEQPPHAWVGLDSTLVTSLTAAKRTISNPGMGMQFSVGSVSFGTGGNVYFEEQCVRDGDRLWATGVLEQAPDGNLAFTGRVTASDRSPERQLKGRTQAVVGFGIVTVLLAIGAALASAGVFGG